MVVVVGENYPHDFSGRDDKSLQLVLDAFYKKCDTLGVRRCPPIKIVFLPPSSALHERAQSTVDTVQRIKAGLGYVKSSAWTVVVVLLSSCNKQILLGLNNCFSKISASYP